LGKIKFVISGVAKIAGTGSRRSELMPKQSRCVEGLVSLDVSIRRDQARKVRENVSV
jgi:hypothetical protein